MNKKIILLSLLMSACVEQVDVAPSARISCEAETDCPLTLVCRAGFCVDPNLESIQPVVSAVTLGRRTESGLETVVDSPARFGPGQTLVVSFEVSETLGSDPVVEFQNANTPGLRAGDCSDAGARCEATRFEYDLTVAPGSEGLVTLFIEVVDEAGNLGSIVLPNRIEFDST
ncbi:MAG: hypothetical protein AAFQ82_04190, partial [Myxococcota bacterium]